MTAYKRGQVVLVPFPFTDLSSVKQRPALVVSSDLRNARINDVIVVAITSAVPTQPADNEIVVPPAELSQWGLPKPSIVKLGKIFTIHQGLIRKTLGRAPDVALSAVLTKLRQQFDD